MLYKTLSEFTNIHDEGQNTKPSAEQQVSLMAEEDLPRDKIF